MENKTFYFAEVEQELMDQVDLDGLFQHRGIYYWFRLVLEEDQFKIEDSCGRIMPIGYEHLGEFSYLVQHLDAIGQIQREADRKIDRILECMDE